MYTRKEFLKFCDLEKKTAKFSVTVTFIELLNAHGLQDLKSVSVINSVEDGFMFNNIRYSAVAMPKPNFITLEVEIPDISQWLLGNPIKAMIKAQQKQARAKRAKAKKVKKVKKAPEQLPIVGRVNHLARGVDWMDSPTYYDEEASGLHQ